MGDPAAFVGGNITPKICLGSGDEPRPPSRSSSSGPALKAAISRLIISRTPQKRIGLGADQIGPPSAGPVDVDALAGLTAMRGKIGAQGPGRHRCPVERQAPGSAAQDSTLLYHGAGVALSTRSAKRRFARSISLRSYQRGAGRPFSQPGPRQRSCADGTSAMAGRSDRHRPRRRSRFPSVLAEPATRSAMNKAARSGFVEEDDGRATGPECAAQGRREIGGADHRLDVNLRSAAMSYACRLWRRRPSALQIQSEPSTVT